MNHPDTFKSGLPACTGREMVLMGDHLKENLEKIEESMLIIHGTKDVIVKLEGSKNLFKKSSSKDKKLLIVEDGYHSVLSDYIAKVKKNSILIENQRKQLKNHFLGVLKEVNQNVDNV